MSTTTKTYTTPAGSYEARVVAPKSHSLCNAKDASSHTLLRDRTLQRLRTSMMNHRAPRDAWLCEPNLHESNVFEWNHGDCPLPTSQTSEIGSTQLCPLYAPTILPGLVRPLNGPVPLETVGRIHAQLSTSDRKSSRFMPRSIVTMIATETFCRVQKPCLSE